MAKRCIGIDIGPAHLRAVQLVQTEDKFCIEKVFCAQTRRSTDSPTDILKLLIHRHGFDRRAAVAVALPPDAVYFRNLETDYAGLEKMRRQDLSELENEFPAPADQVFTHLCSYRQLAGDRYSVLVAAARKTSVQETLDLLAEAKMQPVLAEAGIFAVCEAITANHPEVADGQALLTHINDNCLVLAVIENGNCLMVRNIPFVHRPGNEAQSSEELTAQILRHEAQITWRKTFGSEITADAAIYIAGQKNICNTLASIIKEELPCRIVVADPYAMLKAPVQSCDNEQIWVAEGLALKALAPDKAAAINFLQAAGADRKSALNLKKELVSCTALLGAIVVVWLAGLFIGQTHLETTYAQLKSDIDETFLSALPDEKNIVNPLAQLEQKLTPLRKDYRLLSGFYPGRLEPLEVLQNITTSRPSEGSVKVDDLLVGAKSVRLSGTCDSFDTVYKWQRLLQKVSAFKYVEVDDGLQKDPGSGTVHFTIIISSTVPEQE
jgi:Tfp pilus assembly PilM family ATPase